MSIEIIEVITADDYKTVFPTGAQDTDRIERAINYSFLIIDGVTSGAITERWNLESTETGYLTDEQKDFVRKAFVVQTQYVISQNLDLAQQQKSFSFGGISMSSNKSQVTQLCESARNYLNKAGLFYKTEFVGTSNSSLSLFGTETEEEYVPYSVADKRYLLTTDTTSTHWNKFIKYNNKGAAEFVSASAIVGDNFYTKDECDSTFATIIALLAEGNTRSNKDTELENYCKDLDSTKAAADSVYTKEETYSATEIDQKIATGTGLYLGWLENDAEDLPSESEIGTWIIANWSSLQPSAVEKVTNNDYVFVWFSTQYVYWRVKVVTEATGKVLPSAVTWKKDLEFDDDIIDVKNQVKTNTANIATLTDSKQNKVYYTDDEPEDAVDGDLWAKDGEIESDLFDQIYPVGSIYISVNTTIPTTFKGTWEKLSNGIFLQNASSNLGSEVSAGLPNITGTISTLHFKNGFSGSGCFSLGTYETAECEGLSNGAVSTVTLNASNSSSIYGNSTTVQPYSLNVSMWKRTE